MQSKFSFDKNKKSGMSESERKDFQKKVFNKNKGLSQSEMVEFSRIIDQDVRKKNIRSNHASFANSGYSFEQIMGFIKSSRRELAKSLGFSLEERRALEMVEGDYSNRYMHKVYLYLALLTIDYKHFVKQDLTAKDAVEGKIGFILGLKSFKHIVDDTKKSMFYRIIDLMREYAYYAYNAQDENMIKESNKLMVEFASVLSIGSPDEKKDYEGNSMHMNCAIDTNNPMRQFTFYISKTDAETPEFKYVYDWYFKNEGKSVFEDVLSKKVREDTRKVLSGLDMGDIKSINQNAGNMIASYSNVLGSKLASLHKKGGSGF